MLAVLMFAVALVLSTLAIAAPRLARQLQHEREQETVHRAGQYVRAIQLYYRKFGNYPTSIDQLVNTNNIRFLRQKYTDPMTGKDDWRLIYLGQNKTQSTGFFDKPLSGIGSAGGGIASSQVGSNSVSDFSTTSFGGNAGVGANGSNAGSSGPTTNSGASGNTESMGPGMSSQSATTFTGGGGGPIIGVSSQNAGESIINIHDKDHYNEWEFFYDPRVDQMKAAAIASQGGGGVGSNTVSDFGNSGFGGNGQNGAGGFNGANGPNGTNGANGSNGFNGTNGPTGTPTPAPGQPQQ
jgi:type II secretory pathway pseudopilin PulG